MPRDIAPRLIDIDELKALYPLKDEVEAAGIKLTKTGSGWKGVCPYHDDRTPSFTIYLGKGNQHRFKCQSAGCKAHDGGSVIDFLVLSGQAEDAADAIAYLRQRASGIPVKQRKAVIEKRASEMPKVAASGLRGTPVIPAPTSPMKGIRDGKQPRTRTILNPGREDSPEGSLPIDRLHEYRHADGNLFGYVVRTPKVGKDKKKLTPQVMHLTGVKMPDGSTQNGWCYQGFSHAFPPRKVPPFNAPAIVAAKAAAADAGVIATAYLLEGEKNVEDAKAFMDQLTANGSPSVAMTWVGGAGASFHTDFSLLEGCAAVIWPDADESGNAATAELIERCREAGAMEVLVLPPPADAPKKWDISDALFPKPEFEPPYDQPWDMDRFQQHLETAITAKEWLDRAHVTETKTAGEGNMAGGMVAGALADRVEEAVIVDVEAFQVETRSSTSLMVVPGVVEHDPAPESLAELPEDLSVRTLLELTAQDKGTPFLDAALRFAVALKNDETKEAEYARLEAGMRQQGVSMRQWKRSIQRVEELIANEKRAAELNAVGVQADADAVLPELIEGIDEKPVELSALSRVPGYRVNQMGIWEDDGTGSPRLICPAVIAPMRRIQQEGSRGDLLSVAVRRADRTWDTIEAETADLQGSKVVEQLAKKSVPVHSMNRNQVAKYISEVLYFNLHRLQTTTAVSAIGWVEARDKFLWGPSVVLTASGMQRSLITDPREGICFRPRMTSDGSDKGAEQIVKQFVRSGSRREVKAMLRRIKNYPKMRVLIYAALSPVVMEMMTGCQVVTIDVHGRQQSGKTEGVCAVMSFWGRPDGKSAGSGAYNTGLMRSWGMSQPGIKNLASNFRGLPMWLDESKKLNEQHGSEKARQILYMGEGDQKATSSGGLRETADARVITISTGESSILTFVPRTDGGARSRTISISYPWGRQKTKETAADVEEAGKLCRKNFGWTGPDFVVGLLKLKDQHDAAEREKPEDERIEFADWLMAERDLIAQDLRKRQSSQHKDNDSLERLSKHVALLVLTAKIAHAIRVEEDEDEDNHLLPFGLWKDAEFPEEIWKEIIASGRDAVGGAQALMDVRDWALQNEGLFWGRHDETREPNAFYGSWPKPTTTSEGTEVKQRGRKAEPHLHIFKPQLNETLNRLGYRPDQILTEWKERGWINADETGFTKKIAPYKSGQTSMVNIRMSAIEEVEKMWTTEDAGAPQNENEEG